MTSFDVGIIVGMGYIIHAIQTDGYVGAYFRRAVFNGARTRVNIIRLIFLSKICGISRMSTEHDKQKLREAMMNVKRAEALIVRASRAESEAFHKQHSYSTSLLISMKAKKYLNNAYRSLNGVKEEIRKSMQRSSMKKGGTQRKRKRKHCTRRH